MSSICSQLEMPSVVSVHIQSIRARSSSRNGTARKLPLQQHTHTLTVSQPIQHHVLRGAKCFQQNLSSTKTLFQTKVNLNIPLLSQTDAMQSEKKYFAWMLQDFSCLKTKTKVLLMLMVSLQSSSSSSSYLLSDP